MMILTAISQQALLDTGYISINNDRSSNHVLIRVQGEMWIFAILTTILIMVTGAAWFLLERKNRIVDHMNLKKLESTV